MKIIRLSGYVGFDITSASVADALASANGEDIEVPSQYPGWAKFMRVSLSMTCLQTIQAARHSSWAGSLQASAVISPQHLTRSLPRT